MRRAALQVSLTRLLLHLREQPIQVAQVWKEGVLGPITLIVVGKGVRGGKGGGWRKNRRRVDGVSPDDDVALTFVGLEVAAGAAADDNAGQRILAQRQTRVVGTDRRLFEVPATPSVA